MADPVLCGPGCVPPSWLQREKRAAVSRNQIGQRIGAASVLAMPDASRGPTPRPCRT